MIKTDANFHIDYTSGKKMYNTFGAMLWKNSELNFLPSKVTLKLLNSFLFTYMIH